MLRSKKTGLRIILFALMSLCIGVCLLCFGGTETVYAEETVCVTITVTAYDWWTSKEVCLYSANQTTVNFEEAFESIQEQYPSWVNFYNTCDYSNFKCHIDLKSTIGVDSVDYGDLPMPIEINLKGNTLQLNHGGCWYINNGLTINGEGGSVIFAKTTDNQYSGSIWVDGGDLNAYDTSFKYFDTGRAYPFLCIDTDASNAYFSNCSFEDCHSTAYGGVIYMDETNSLHLRNCSFKNCSSYYGGAIFIEDIVANSSNYFFEALSCSFKECFASYGGCIYAENNKVWDYQFNKKETQFFHFDDTDFEKCSATYDGGALYTDCDSGSLLFGNGAKIENCSAGRYGGGIFATGDLLCISDSEIKSCTAKYGGGVFFDGDHPVLTDCNIHDCTASKEGGAHYTEYDFSYTGNNSFTGNKPSNGNATLLSGGSVWIICVVGGVALITAGVFMVLYFKTKKKNKTDNEIQEEINEVNFDDKN